MTRSTITITGTQASQYTVNTSSLSPFSNVIIADSAAGQIETVTVALQAPGGVAAPGNGLLSNLGAGSYDAATGVYTVVGTAAEVTAALNNLVFTPTNADAPEHTVFDISVVDSAGNTAFDRITTVVSAHPTTIATNGATTLASVANAVHRGEHLRDRHGVSEAQWQRGHRGPVRPAGRPSGRSRQGAGTKSRSVPAKGSIRSGTSTATATISATPRESCRARTTAELAAMEANFGELGANAKFLGATPATPSTIANERLGLASDRGPVRTEPRQRGERDPLLEFNGALSSRASWAGWTPVEAVQTGNGYEVASRTARASIRSGTSTATATTPATPPGFCRSGPRPSSSGD